MHPVVIIGAGPAGLMAAEAICRQGLPVDVYDAMPSPGRKFLLAGIGGLNLTHSEDYARFCGRYGSARPHLQAALDALPPEALRAWAQDLGIETFVGSSGRVFPVEMKAAPLLRAWLHRLRATGMRLHVRHRWQGWNEDGSLRFATPAGLRDVHASATVLALGGASWPQLGSDGAWLPLLRDLGVGVSPLQSANCGFEVPWSAHLRTRFAGAQLKSVALSFTHDGGRRERRPGELTVTEHGVEGGLVYAFSQLLRDRILRDGTATFHLDLLPGRDAARVLADVSHPRGARSLSSHLQSRLGLTGVKVALLHECLGARVLSDPAQLAIALKALPVTVSAPRPIAEAISTAGGVRFDSLNEHLMLRDRPGVFVTGEMLDWEAPTGGYLLNGCMATGAAAGRGVVAWLGAR